MIGEFLAPVQTRHCEGCGDEIPLSDISGDSHAILAIEEVMVEGHDCDGTSEDCYRRCPIAIPERRQTQAQCGPIGGPTRWPLR